MTESVTVLWTLSASPLAWKHSPGQVEDWRYLGPTWWARYVDVQQKRENHLPQSLVPASGDLEYPRLVRNPEQGVLYYDRKAQPGVYTQLAGVLPDFFTSTSSQLRPSLEDIKRVADKYGMLFAPQHGDSVFAWAAASLRFQMLQNLWYALQLEHPDYESQYVHQRLDKLVVKYRETVVMISTGSTELSFSAVNIAPPISLFRYDRPDTDWPSADELRVDIERWLVSELNDSLTPYGSIESYFSIETSAVAGSDDSLYDDAKPSSEVDFPAKSTLTPHFCIKCGLYGFAIFDFLIAFRKRGEMRQCKGCGKVFLPNRVNQFYCPESSNRCRQLAQRGRARKH